MTDRLALNDHVNTLTRETTHTTEAITPTGTKYVKADSLLNQLRGAIRPTMKGGGGTSSKNTLPLNPDALDLYNRINETATDYWSLFTQTHTVHGTLEHRIQSWTSRVTREDDIRTAERITRGWVTEIGHLFDPPVIRPLQRPCPECGAVKAHVDKDGETVLAWSLTVDITAGMHARSLWTAACANCEARWLPGELDQMLAALDEAQ